jgi:hypothetical protein
LDENRYSQIPTAAPVSGPAAIKIDQLACIAWTIMKAKHKLGRLSLKTTNSMLANPETPPAVRALVEKYLSER